MTWSETWPLLLVVILGLIIGHMVGWERGWLRGKREGYSQGREDEKRLCGIEHPRKLTVESITALVQFDRRHGRQCRGSPEYHALLRAMGVEPFEEP